MQNNDEAKVKSVKKALDLLTALVFDDPQRAGQPLSVLAGRHGLPSNTAHSLLQTLVTCGYACQTEGGLYAAGEVCRQIGTMNLLHSGWMVKTLLPGMKAFSLNLAADAVFAVLGAGKRIVAAKAEGNGMVRVNLSAMEMKTFYSVPTGRVLAAWAAQAELKQIVRENGLPGAAWGGARTEGAFAALLCGVRGEASVQMEEPEPGLFSCAVPLLRQDGSLMGALGAYLPLYGLRPEKKTQLVHGLLALAQSIREDESS